MTDPQNRAIEPIPPEPEPKGRNYLRWLLIGLGVFAVLILIALIISIAGAVTDNGVVIRVLAVLRDFVIIVLVLQGIVIAVVLIVLVFQVNVLIVMLREEIKPILRDTRETLTTVRGTAEFVSRNVTRPVIQATSFAAGVRSLVGEITGLRKTMRRTSPIPAKKPTAAPTSPAGNKSASTKAASSGAKSKH